MAEKKEVSPVSSAPEFRPVNLKVAVTLQRQQGAVESCCNYDITGSSGNMLLVLPPMTHIQDMPR
ncbi:MAG: hypothetical protein DMF53_21215 [Acidobacteria bacterium]|nr:MAG: hypothetical protein DMF53_21215 [Acidobacteriota bacterium]